MTNLVSDPNVRTLLQVDTLLVLGLMLMSSHTSLLRLRRKVYATAEDYALNGIALPGASPEAPGSSELSDPIARSRRVHRNHLENVLPFLVLSALYALTAPGHALFAGLLWSFVAVRLTYTVFYLRSKQPHRTIAFAVGVVLQLTIAVLTLVATLTA
jgi:glutathione S-transferase